MKKRVITGLVTIAFLLGTFLSGCSIESTGAAPASSTSDVTQTGEPSDSNVIELGENWPENVTMAAGIMGAPWYPFLVQFCDILNREIPSVSWTVIEGTAVGNIRSVQDGTDVQMGLAHLPTLIPALANTLSITEGETFDKIVLGPSPTASYLQTVVRADSDIYSYADLADKRISAGLVTSGAQPITANLLELHEMSYDSIIANGGKVEYADYGTLADMLKDKTMDAVIFSGDIPLSNIMEIEASLDVRLLGLQDDIITALNNNFPELVVADIPAGTYNGQDTAVSTVLQQAVFIFNTDECPDDFIYTIMRVLMDHSETLAANNPALITLGWDTSIACVPEELLAPGVSRVFDEGPCA